MRYVAIMPAVLALGLLVAAAQAKSIKDVMNACNKGKDALCGKAVKGMTTDEENKKLLENYTLLGTFKPPMGDEKSWKDKTDALIAAAKDLVDKKAGAADKFKAAIDCKACHSVHKGK
jgi:hypothetical protein